MEESRKRAQELVGQIKTLKSQVVVCEKEYGQIIEVLRALKAESALDIIVQVEAKTVMESSTIAFEYPEGRTNRLEKATIERILMLPGELRSAHIAKEISKEVGRAQTDSALSTASNIYLKYLVVNQLIVKVSHGRYKVVKKEIPDKSLPRIKNDADDNTEIHIVDGIVTLQKPDGGLR